MSDREVKKLEKVLAQEAKADLKAIDHAMKDVKAAEKALQKCAKVRRVSYTTDICPQSDGALDVREGTEEGLEAEGEGTIHCKGAQ